MKKAVLFFTASMLIASVAVAQPKPQLDAKTCQQMAEYQPSPDVDYKPGVDVHGKPVVEADLNPSPIQVPDVVSFNLTVDLAQYAGMKTPKGLEEEAVMGKVTVDKTGHMTFNGQPLEGPAQKALRDLCAPKPPIPATRLPSASQ